MSEMSQLALNPVGPRQGRIRALPVTSSAANVDLTTLTELSEGIAGNMLLSLTAEGDVYYAFAADGATPIDRTNTTASNAAQCDFLPSGASRDLHIPWAPGTGGNSGALLKFLHHQSSAATATLRISVASETLHNRMR